MKTKIFATLVPIFLIVLLGYTLNNSNPEKVEYLKFKTSVKYEKEWAKVDSLDRIGLPKSALEIVELIYKDARIQKNHNQFIKALIYRLKFKNSIEENAFENLIYEINDEIKLSSFPANSIMHSILAEMYWMYYQNNRWKFFDRSQTVNFELNDIKTWDLNTLSSKIISESSLSIQNSDSLQRTDIKDFSDILILGNFAHEIRPTLYDFLANRAITTLSNQELTVSKPADYFELKEDFYFADNESFFKNKITTKDTLSTKLKVVELYQKILKFHNERKNVDAIIDADLNRLSFVYKNSVNDLKDSLYLTSLQNIEKKYSESKSASKISYSIAQFYFDKSSAYNALQEETSKYKWYKKTAFNICNSILKSDSVSNSAQKAKYLINQISTQKLSFEAEQNMIPDQNFAVRISYTNTPKTYFKVLKIQADALNKLKDSYYSYELYEKLVKESIVVYSKSFDLKDDGDFNNHSTEVILDKLPIGTYIIVLSDENTFKLKTGQLSYQIVTSTNLSYFYKNIQSQEYDFYVTNRSSGEPMQNVKLTLYYRNYNYSNRKYELKKGETFISDASGHVKINNSKVQNDNSFSVKLEKDEDVFFSNYTYYLYENNHNEREILRTHLFTDRAIYRPGQTIHFKGILINELGEKREIVPNLKQTVTLYDVNYQKVSSLELTTNEFGTYSGTFDIPTGLLNGSMQISTSNGSIYVSVEEYKRPKFEVKILPLNGNYKLNEKIEISGNAKEYSGANVSDAKVTYSVVREPVFRYWWYRNYNQTSIEIVNGESKTDDNGEYKISFDAIPDLKYPKDKNISFNYKISVQVTDINGESQRTEKNVRVGYVALEIDNNIGKNINKDNDLKYEVSTQNLNYETIPAQGEIKIYKLIDVEKPIRKKLWNQVDNHQYTKQDWDKFYPNNQFDNEDDLENLKKGALVFEDKFNTNITNKHEIKNISSWSVGAYIIEMKSKDSFGNVVESQKRFIVYSENSKQIPVKSYAWFSSESKTYEVSENATFLIGTSKENVRVLYEIEHKGKIVKSEWITLNNEQKKIVLPIVETYRGNVSVHFSFVKDSRFFNFDKIVTVPFTNKQIDIKFETFRNKLYPGEKEEWKLVLKGKNGEKVAAEMLATLYDASLDNFKQNYWSFNIFKSYYSQITSQSDVFNSGNSLTVRNNYKNVDFPYEAYDALNWFGFYYYSYYSRGYRGAEGLMSKSSHREKAKGYAMAEEFDEAKVQNEAAPVSMSLEVAKNDASISDKDSEDSSREEGLLDARKPADVQVRSNFNETAFFYPHLQTNEKGEIVIKFTIPESLTKWKMMGFAHTKDLMSGMIENELVTQKELMVQPNAPRFFRENDQIVFPAKISNLADKTQNCDVSIKLYDAISMKDVTSQLTKSPFLQKITVEAGKNAVVKWTLQIPAGIQAIGYKIIAKSEIFSDGEENVVPVMTNRILVTESLPLPIRKAGTKEFKFEKLVNSAKSTTLRNQNLTLEFTSNPAWYAVQALPYLMEYPYECAEQTFSRYYANSIATYVANSNPKIKSVFESWKNLPNSEALLSNLEKNQDLKSALLQETPWVLDAQSETERKHRIGLLFDLNKMSNQLQTAVTKLKKLQVSNGGWPWFEGMPDNRYITQHIVCGFGHLNKLNIVKVRENREIWNMVSKAIPYLDARMLDDYEYLKKHYTEIEMKQDLISQIEIQYLYTRSFFSEIQMNKKSQEAYNYFFGQAQKYWMNKDKYSQALLGLALFRNDGEKTTSSIIKSLKEHSLTNEEMGMYWKDNISGYYWYQAPIETQAIMIELFNECTTDQNTVEDLKVWLLKQKQTQDWKTTKATVEAVYALLLTGKDWLTNTDLVKVSLGNILVDPANDKKISTEAGTGYFKKSWTASEISSEMGNIKVTKSNDGVAWGALYWQYFEQLDKITTHETPLKLNKKLFLEKPTSSGKVIEPISDNTKLKVGDKIIVRIELRVDRDMDYVHMKDMRASGFEPLNVFSGYRWQGGLGYYETTKDASTNFFFDKLRKGTYVFEYPLVINHEGDFSNGITTIQSMYAPEFTSHSEGVRVIVK